MRLSLCLAVVLFSLIGCQASAPIEGSSDYSLGGKELRAPNQARVENPYSFHVELEWQDKKAVLAAHGVRLAIFEGMNEPGPIRVFKLDEKGARIKELTLVSASSGLLKSGKVYQVR
ncbi:MAG: hypothetical protein M3Q63_03640 [bacterium]|nr:hypothetical protein [bacterium]